MNFKKNNWTSIISAFGITCLLVGLCVIMFGGTGENSVGFFRIKAQASPSECQSNRSSECNAARVTLTNPSQDFVSVWRDGTVLICTNRPGQTNQFCKYDYQFGGVGIIGGTYFTRYLGGCNFEFDQNSNVAALNNAVCQYDLGEETRDPNKKDQEEFTFPSDQVLATKLNVASQGSVKNADDTLATVATPDEEPVYDKPSVSISYGEGKVTEGDCDTKNFICRAIIDNKPTFLRDCKLETRQAAGIVSGGTNFDQTSDVTCATLVTGNLDGKTVKEIFQAPGAATGVSYVSDPVVSNPDNLLTLLLDLVSQFLLFIVWVIGWGMQGILWMIMGVFFTFLRINPAGPDFLSVAIEPWRVIVTIANVLTLAAFLYTGFQYVLGVAKKQKINDFILNIIVVLLTINFTIFAAATFVNIAQGLGDAFVGGYSVASGQADKDWGTVMFDNFINAIREVSLVRCGNVETVTGAPAADCQSTDGLGQVGRLTTQIFRSAGQAQAALIGELTFVVVIGYAIYVMWRGMITAQLRVVGLWMLMVTSPIALAAAFSPIPRLKKVADDWMNKFLSLTFFYPVFVLGMILVGLIAKTFGQAARTQINGLTGVSESGIITQAQADGDPNVIAGTLLTLVLTGFVAVGSLNILIDFMGTFDKLIEAAWKGVKDLVTNSAILSGAAVRLAGGSIAKSNQNKILNNDGVISNARRTLKGLKKEEKEANKMDNDKLRNKRLLEIKAKRKSTIGQLKSANEKGTRLRNWKNAGDAISNRGSQIQAAPAVLGAMLNLPKNILKNQKRVTEGRIDSEVAGTEFDAYLQLYKSGVIDQKAVPLEYQQDILRASKNPNEVQSIRSNVQTRAFNKKVDSALPRGNKATVATINELAKKIGPDLSKVNRNSEELNSLVEILSKSADNPAVLREIAFNEDTRKLAQQIVEQNLVDGDVYSKLSKYPGFISGGMQGKRAVASSVVGNDESMRNYDFSALAADPELLKAFYEEMEVRFGKEEAIKQLNQRTGSRGYPPRAIDNANEAIKNAGLNQETQQVALAALSTTLAGGQNSNEIIRRMVEQIDPKTDRIGDSEITNIVTASRGKQYGGNTPDEIESLQLPQLENTRVGKTAKQNPNYQNLSPSDKEQALRVANKAALEADKLINPNILARSAEVYHEKSKKAYQETQIARQVIAEAKANRVKTEERFRKQQNLENEAKDEVKKQIDNKYDDLLLERRRADPNFVITQEQKASIRSQAEAYRVSISTAIEKQNQDKLSELSETSHVSEAASSLYDKTIERVLQEERITNVDEVADFTSGFGQVLAQVSRYIENPDKVTQESILLKANELAAELSEGSLKDELTNESITALIAATKTLASDRNINNKNTPTKRLLADIDRVEADAERKIRAAEVELRNGTHGVSGESEKILQRVLSNN